MVAVIIGAHGSFAVELLATSRMIFGQRDNIAAVALEPGESFDCLVEKYKAVLQCLDTQEGVLFLTDLFGGSPYNAACKIAIETEKTSIVAGVNLPMVLEVLSLKDLSIAHVEEIAQRAGKQGIKSFEQAQISNCGEEL
jgi:PTS system mannose-specific IIA component